MLDREQITHAVDLQARGYRLLLWLEKAFDQGFIAPEAAHRYASLDSAAHAWLSSHYANLPSDVRPPQGDLLAFSKLFSTYLQNTFDLEANPGRRLHSPDAHCFCPMCSWMVRVPHLRPKKVGTADKTIAERMKRGFLRALAIELQAATTEAELDALLADATFREPIALCTYASDLLQRLEGVAVGPASLALWRAFAWTPQGSPKQGFKLSGGAIMDAQRAISDRLSSASM